MQINLLPPGPPMMMEMSIFARPSVEMQQYINQHNQQLEYRMTNMYGEAGTRYLQQTNEAYKNYADTSGLLVAERLVEQTNTALSSNAGHLTPLNTYEELQSAHLRYQDYLMANPAITTLFLQGRISGYSDTWVNTQGNAVGWQRDAYREIADGMGRSSFDPDFNAKELDEHYTHCSTSEDMVDQDGNLFNRPSFYARINVLNAWHLQNQAIQENIDTTSVDGFEIRPED